MVNLSEIKLQKERKVKKIFVKKELKFGDKGFMFLKTGRLELNQIFFFKKTLKKLYKRKKSLIFLENKKIWFYIKPNHIIQKKTKNSRMGKGKGSFERKIIRVNQNKIFIEFKGLSLIKLKKIIIKINKKFNIRFKLIYKYNYVIKTCL